MKFEDQSRIKRQWKKRTRAEGEERKKLEEGEMNKRLRKRKEIKRKGKIREEDIRGDNQEKMKCKRERKR